MAWAYVAASAKLQDNISTGDATIVPTANMVQGNRAFLVINSWRLTGGTAPPIILGVSDTKGNTWNLDDAQTYLDSGIWSGRMEVWSAHMSSAILTSDTVTVDFDTIDPDNGNLILCEASGISTSVSAVDVSILTDDGGARGSLPATGNSANTTAANEFVLVVYGNDGWNLNWVVQPAGTVIATNMPNLNPYGDIWVAYKDSGASGTPQSANGTTDNDTPWVIGAITYALAPAAEVTPFPPSSSYAISVRNRIVGY